jgi:hypothetical protein
MVMRRSTVLTAAGAGLVAAVVLTSAGSVAMAASGDATPHAVASAVGIPSAARAGTAQGITAKGMTAQVVTTVPDGPIGSAIDCTGAGQYCFPDGQSGVLFTITGSGCQYDATIDWGDGSTPAAVTNYQNGQVVDHKYTKTGVYTVSTVSTVASADPGATCTGSSNSWTGEVPVRIDVVPNWVISQATPPSSTQRAFAIDASGTTVTPPDTTLTFDWSVWSTGATSTGKVLNATFTCTGTTQTQMVTLNIHALRGTANKPFQTSFGVSVLPCSLTVVPAFTATRTGSTATGTSYGFDASATTVTPSDAQLSYSWAFGDGGTATGPTASHTYACTAAERTVSVVLTATATWQGEQASATATKTVTVDACTVIVVPVPPHAVNDNLVVPAGTTVTGNVLTNDSTGHASNGGPFRLRVVVSRAPQHGRIVMNRAIAPAAGAGSFSYAPARNFCGIDSATYTIDPPADPNGRLSSSATIYFYVCGDNLPLYLRGLARQAGQIGGRDAARIASLISSAAALIEQGNQPVAATQLQAALRLERNALISAGIRFALN